MKELKRSFFQTLVQWKKNKGQDCLLIKGARQIGKTFIVRKFGRECYNSFVEVNFIEHPELGRLFEGPIQVDSIASGITAVLPEVRFVPGNTLLFLDEIQECPNARTSLKTFAMDGRYDVVASGSLLGIKYKNKTDRERMEPRSIAVGYERQAFMHSLSFREFLWARGYGDDIIENLEGYFRRLEPVPDPIHRKFMALLREYAVVGGMPAVASGFAENGHYGDVQAAQEMILAATVDDIHKYASADSVGKIEECYRAVPRILAKENRKFKYSEVEKGGSARKYLTCVEWLRDARLAVMAECVEAPLAGLSAYVREGWFKLYMEDIGLLLASYGMAVKRQILDDTLSGSMKGGIYENLIAGILLRNGFPLYYLNDSAHHVEMEFFAETPQGVIPIEVKARTGRTLSLDGLLARNEVPFGYKFTSGNVGKSGKKITLPHYFSMFLRPYSEP